MLKINVFSCHEEVENHMKRSRARVTLGGQCVLLQNSLKIKLFDFFFSKSQNYRMNHIFPDILLNP